MISARVAVWQLVAVGLVVFFLGEVGLDLRTGLLETAEAEAVVDRLHLAERVADELLVADFVEVLRRNQVLLRE